MNTPGFLKCGGAAAALAIVAACSSASTSLSPPSAAGSPFTTSYRGKMLFVNGRPVTAARMRFSHHYAQLLPDVKANTYEYVFNFYNTYASIFKYPKRNDMVGMINDLGGQGCTNVLYGYGKHIFWNAARIDNQVTEY
ncbi:MAG TPA: hypothetical protein VGF18_01865, partial [Candidatus Tumulicola sp.]